MTVEEFARVLNLGLGRAILHLQTHDPAPYRDAILYACLNSTSYDPQVEGDRVDYLLEVIAFTGEEAYFRDQILAALPTLEYRDAVQLLHFALCFAEQGHEEARRKIYEQEVASYGTSYYYFYLEYAVALNGESGLLYAAERIGDLVLSDQIHDLGIWHPIGWWHSMDKWDDEAREEWNLVQKAAENNPSIKAYVDAFLAERERKTDERRKQPYGSKLSKYTYEDVKHLLATTPEAIRDGFTASEWGKRAAPPELEYAALDLLNAVPDDIDGMLLGFNIFRKTPFPLDPQKLVDYLGEKAPKTLNSERYTQEHRLVAMGLVMLSNVTHPAVRELALTAEHARSWLGHLVDLLESNWNENDWQFVERVLNRQLDEFNFHGVGHSVLDLAELYPSEQAIAALLKVYEWGNCSWCRRHAVEQIHALKALPDWIITESRHDSNFDLREWIEREFPPVEKT